jgi:hypothetical protein
MMKKDSEADLGTAIDLQLGSTLLDLSHHLIEITSIVVDLGCHLIEKIEERSNLGLVHVKLSGVDSLDPTIDGILQTLPKDITMKAISSENEGVV